MNRPLCPSPPRIDFFMFLVPHRETRTISQIANWYDSPDYFPTSLFGFFFDFCGGGRGLVPAAASTGFLSLLIFWLFLQGLWDSEDSLLSPPRFDPRCG